MISAKSKYNFSGSSFIDDPLNTEQEVDPLSGLANLADVMLVLACGLMMALVVFWNLDLPTLTELDDTSMQEVDEDNIEEIVDDITSSTSPYYELGRVYQDPTTGKMYVLQETDEDADASTDDSAATDTTDSNSQTSADDADSVSNSNASSE